MVITHLNNLQLKLDEACGGAVAVELRMRLIGELCKKVRDKVKELVTNDHLERAKKNPKAKRGSDKYSECKLYFLDEAIDQIFHDKMDSVSRQKIADFR